MNTLLILAYNEETYIEKVILNNINNFDKILIVNDGSKDRTLEIINSLATLNENLTPGLDNVERGYTTIKQEFPDIEPTSLQKLKGIIEKYSNVFTPTGTSKTLPSKSFKSETTPFPSTRYIDSISCSQSRLNGPRSWCPTASKSRSQNVNTAWVNKVTSNTWQVVAGKAYPNIPAFIQVDIGNDKEILSCLIQKRADFMDLRKTNSKERKQRQELSKSASRGLSSHNIKVVLDFS